MCTSTVADADASPAQPEIAIGDSTIERSGIATSVALVAAHPVGTGVGDGLGLGVGVAVGLGVGLGVTVGVGVELGVVVGVGLGVGVGFGVAAVWTPQSGLEYSIGASPGSPVRVPVPSLAIVTTAPAIMSPHGPSWTHLRDRSRLL